MIAITKWSRFITWYFRIVIRSHRWTCAWCLCRNKVTWIIKEPCHVNIRRQTIWFKVHPNTFGENEVIPPQDRCGHLTGQWWSEISERHQRMNGRGVLIYFPKSKRTTVGAITANSSYYTIWEFLSRSDITASWEGWYIQNCATPFTISIKFAWLHNTILF